MRNRILAILLFFCSLSAFAQADRHDVRAGNRKYRQKQYKEAEIDYRKGLDMDSTSVTARYDLASSLYKQEDYEEAYKTYMGAKTPLVPPQYYYNAGNAAARMKEWGQAVNMYKMALLMDPTDMAARENYIYARKMLGDSPDSGQPQMMPYQGEQPPPDQDQDEDQDQQDQDQGQDQDQPDQDQNQDPNQQDQNQNRQDQNQDRQNQDQRQNAPSEQMSPRQMQMMLQAIRDQEKNTQDKVNKERAMLQEKSRHKEKNW